MKKTGIYITLLLVSSFSWISCDKDVLNKNPLSKFSADATWADGALSEAFVFGVYSFLGYGGFEEQALAAYTDEAMFTHAGRNISTWTEGTENASSIAWVSPTYEWSAMYEAIRAANIALEQLATSTFENDELRERLTGEAHFLRAYYYQQLLRYYGGVPLIDLPAALDDDFEVARNTYEENVNFIVADLEQAIDLLDGKEDTPGRASMLAAMALKSRVLLYAASDIHDGPTASSVGAIGEYNNLELVAYTSGDQQARWQAARTAAKDVVDAGAGQGYKFGLSDPVSPEKGRANYIAIAMGGGSGVADAGAASELIFQRTATALFSQEDDWPLGPIHYGVNNGPNGYHNWAGNTPIQQLVDDYELMDGSKFDWNNPAHTADPYANRDPRFYATILYDGADWKPRPADVTKKDPSNQIQTGAYDDGSDGLIPGIDTRESPIENWNGSRTHYYTRKFIDPDPGIEDVTTEAQVVPWPFIRYTEMVLNYVEASLELGDEGEARNWLNQIRFRAGMPATTATGSDLVDLYRNERRVELAYEEHRFHDVRRWMIPEETVGRGIKIIDVKAKLKSGATALNPYHHDKSVYDYTYTVVDNTEIETRQWVDAMYYRALTRDELNKNTLLVQNPGYQ